MWMEPTSRWCTIPDEVTNMQRTYGWVLSVMLVAGCAGSGDEKLDSGIEVAGELQAALLQLVVLLQVNLELFEDQ